MNPFTDITYEAKVILAGCIAWIAWLLIVLPVSDWVRDFMNKR